jgi:hypothetical protein
MADNEQPKDIAQNNPTAPAPLPQVESPPLSLAGSVEAPVAPIEEPVKPTEEIAARTAAWRERLAGAQFRMPNISHRSLSMPHLKISRRVRYRAALAATVLLAACFGAAIGSVATRTSTPPPPKLDTTALEESLAAQKSVARLSKELNAVRASIESSGKDTRSQIAKINEKITEKINDKLAERADRAADVTGSIAKQAMAAAPLVEKPQVAPMPMPVPRPVVSQPAIVQGWSVREGRNGRVLVESRGEFYEVVQGVPLPGLGQVEAVRREGDRWVVVTPKGIITSEEKSAAVRQRPYYPPYYRPY